MFINFYGFAKFISLLDCDNWIKTLSNKTMKSVYPFVHPSSNYSYASNRPLGISSDGIPNVIVPIDGSFKEAEVGSLELLSLETIKQEGYL